MVEGEFLVQQFPNQKSLSYSSSAINHCKNRLVCLIQSLNLFDFLLSSDNLLCHTLSRYSAAKIQKISFGAK